MSCLNFLGYLAKILFLDTYANISQLCTKLDIFMSSTMSRSWQDFPRFGMFLLKMFFLNFISLGADIVTKIISECNIKCTSFDFI